MESSNNQPSHWEKRADSAGRWIRFAPFLIVSVPASYILWFGIIQRLPPSANPADWGTFGDFVGGILNPIAAFIAFFWLWISIGLQREELKATRAELAEAANAQKKTAEHHATMKKIEDCRAFVELHSTKIDSTIVSHSKASGGAPRVRNLENDLAQIVKTHLDGGSLSIDHRTRAGAKIVASSLVRLIPGLREWETLHNEERCFSVDYYKLKYAKLAYFLRHCSLIDEKSAEYYAEPLEDA